MRSVTVLDWVHRVVVVGEVGQAHEGSLGMAHAFVDAIADAGADAVKFQTHIAAAESRTDEPWRVEFSYAHDSPHEDWKRMEFTAQAWSGLRRHAEDRGLAFLSTPFSLEAVDLLRGVGVAAWKVASGEVANPQRLGLNVLAQIRDRYGCATGLSDHSGTIFPALAAVALGGRVIEVHVTLSREMFGPDVAASVTSSELRLLVDGVRYVEAALAAPVDKDEVAVELAPMRALFGRSLVARRALPAGHMLAADDPTPQKPGGAVCPP